MCFSRATGDATAALVILLPAVLLLALVLTTRPAKLAEEHQHRGALVVINALGFIRGGSHRTWRDIKRPVWWWWWW
jgi:hypothetical protein